MAESSIRNLTAAWGNIGEEPDPSTLSGLLSALQKLSSESESDALRQEIQSGLIKISASLKAAIADTEMEMSRLPDYSPVLEIYDVALESYAVADEVIEALSSDELALTGEKLAESIEEVELIVQDVKRGQRLWDRWLASSQAQCSKCGFQASGQSDCPDCGTDLLVPDARPRESSLGRQAVLGAEYLRAYNLYLELLDGKVRLETFVDSLVPISRNARNWGSILGQIGDSGLPQDSQTALVNAVIQTHRGIALVHDAQSSRLWSHINDGWNSIFHAAAEIQQQLPALYRATGSEDEARKLEGTLRSNELA